MGDINEIKNSLIEQCKSAISKTDGVFAEYLISDDDYLLVTFSVSDKGLEIVGDFELEKRFSGEVFVNGEGFCVPWDPEYFDNIDHYLQMAAQEISEGYLCVNGLFFD